MAGPLYNIYPKVCQGRVEPKQLAHTALKVKSSDVTRATTTLCGQDPHAYIFFALNTVTLRSAT